MGEHRDFGPGPLGKRALIQLVTSTLPGERDEVVLEREQPATP